MRAALILIALLAGCATQERLYYRTDGRSTRGDPALSQQFERDRAICQGEVAKADLASTAPLVRRMGEGDVVMEGCMARQGYLLR